MTLDPTTGRSFAYWSENELVGASGGFTFGHDAVGRIIDVGAGGVVSQRFIHDGVHMTAAADTSGITERYVRGDGPDELIAWYEGSGSTNRRWAHQDERGSVVAVSDAADNVAINRYDEFGKPAATNAGRFQYTGQLWLPEAGLYHYKARAHAPHLGRFMQTDPIGYAGGVNLYAYVGNDPVNFVDPLGLTEDKVITWTGPKPQPSFELGLFGGNLISDMFGNILGGVFDCNKLGCSFNPDIKVRGRRPGRSGGGKGGGGGSGWAATEKELPRCLQNFLKGRIAGNPASITLHDQGGGLPNWFDNSVTYGSDIHLAEGMFGRTDAQATIHKFHEIGHSSQNAKMGLNSFNHFSAYLAFGSHDASPLEEAATDFAKATYEAYKAAGLNKSCPF